MGASRQSFTILPCRVAPGAITKDIGGTSVQPLASDVNHTANASPGNLCAKEEAAAHSGPELSGSEFQLLRRSVVSMELINSLNSGFQSLKQWVLQGCLSRSPLELPCSCSSYALSMELCVLSQRQPSHRGSHL